MHKDTQLSTLSEGRVLFLVNGKPRPKHYVAPKGSVVVIIDLK